MPQLASVDASIVAKDKRNFPIDFEILDGKETIIEYEIPHNFSIKYMPDNVTEDTPWIKFIAEYSRNDNKLIFSQRQELKKNVIEVKDYPAFKAFHDKLARQIKQRVILEKVK